MAFSELETKRLERVVSEYIDKRRPPPHIRDELDLGFQIRGQSIEIFEIRPLWNDNTKRIEQAVAKATYVKNQHVWKIYWQRADLKWHRYDPVPEVNTVEEFLSGGDVDDHCCCFG